MARFPRIHVPGSIHHLMARGNGGQAIIGGPDEFARLRSVIASVKKTSDFKLYAYCLMTNHLHLLVEVGNVPISRIMQRIMTAWSKRFNISRRRTGHVFQGRFKSRNCSNDAYFKWLLRYIHLNPVSAGLVSRPEKWPWSSYADYIRSPSPEGRLADIEWPLSLFGRERKAAAESFRKFVLRGLQGRFELPSMSDSRVPAVLVRDSTIAAGVRRPLADLACDIGKRTGVDPSAIRGVSRIHRIAAARALFAVKAAANGYGVLELARELGVSTSAVSMMLRRAGGSQHLDYHEPPPLELLP